MSTANTTEIAVNVAGLADILRCSQDKVYRMARAKDIPSFRVGRALRFFPSQVHDALTAPKPSWTQSKRSTARRRRSS